ncbi:hypothetical protein GPECTOR_54g248 [Gonium pectorale]|uniref:Uncharacterized protein n=1 Tax=Gonium pectorale TaxID=33097 RepID=A0A150G6K9_GONPE|nr:hypothetical protein GPECTOR_54g248 [Gonium pectorale]|eukprot:KXZ45506.1 hypothetical protein GPECTOR_54g248 [Gonium pectorale]
MAEDAQDEGTPSALRPRPGWDTAARNPDIVHGPIDPATVSSTGYLTSSYQPPKVTSPPLSVAASELDQSAFTEQQQGHNLGRTSGGQAAATTGSGRGSSDVAPLPDILLPPADGRPGWDGRFHLDKAAWEMAPRTTLLRPPSPNSLPSVSPSGASRPRHSELGDGTAAQRRMTGTDGVDLDAAAPGSTDGFGARTTILPGLNAVSPAIRTSPYFFSQNGGAPGSPGQGDAPVASKPGAKRQSVTNLSDTYVGRAYSPDDNQKRASMALDGTSTPDGAGSGGATGATGAGKDGPEAADEGGVDGRGTHLPSLDRAYFGRPAKDVEKEKKAGAGGDKGANAKRRGAAERASKVDMLGAVYMPGMKLRTSSKKKLTGPVSNRLYPYGAGGGGSSGSGGHAAEDGSGGLYAGYGGGGTSPARVRDTGLAGPWKPSGKQTIPEPPPAPGDRPKAKLTAEEQAEADRRRAAPRDPSTYSPERYPLVGQGWFLPQEKFPPNPAYANVRAKYMEAKRPQSDTEGDTKRELPDIHTKPWLNPGKHLLTDSSAQPPKVSGTAGARPAYGFSPSATAQSAHSTARPNKGTQRAAKGKAKGKGGKAADKSFSGSEDGSEPEGDAEELAVIRGVRLVSMTKRNGLADELQLEAEEDAQFKAEDEAAAKRESETREGTEEAAAEGKAKVEHGDDSKPRKRASDQSEPEEKEQGSDSEPEPEREDEDSPPVPVAPAEKSDSAPDEDRSGSSNSVQRSGPGPNGEKSFDEATEDVSAASKAVASAEDDVADGGSGASAKAAAEEPEGAGDADGGDAGDADTGGDEGDGDEAAAAGEEAEGEEADTANADAADDDAGEAGEAGGDEGEADAGEEQEAEAEAEGGEGDEDGEAGGEEEDAEDAGGLEAAEDDDDDEDLGGLGVGVGADDEDDADQVAFGDGDGEDLPDGEEAAAEKEEEDA